MRHRRSFPYETSHADVWIPLSASGPHESTMLYARIWRPHTSQPVPALLEYAPDRLGDSTAARDAQRHPWYAGHGYASVRVDARGHGGSGGSADPSAALPDGLAVIDWLAAQPWCNGRIGAFGIGQGATWALALSERAPEPLGAVVAVCAEDQPAPSAPPGPAGASGSFSAIGTPVHLGLAHSRATDRLSAHCLPPDPLQPLHRDIDGSWRARWLNRLAAVAPTLPTGFEQRRSTGDDSRDASPDADNRPRPPLLAVSGWRAPDHDTVLRLLTHREPSHPVRALIGPWSDTHYPDHGQPGPAIGFLQETLRWFDRHLKDPGGGSPDEPLLRSWIDGHHAHWAVDTSWPSPRLTRVEYALHGLPTTLGPCPRPEPQDGSDHHGPPADAAHSLCCDLPVGTRPVEILGHPQLTLRLQYTASRGRLLARLHDIAPDGSSTEVSSGVLDLPRSSRPTPQELSLTLESTGYAFAPGHHIRLTLICPCGPPWDRPAPEDSRSITFHPEDSRWALPVRARPPREHPTPHGGEQWTFDAPEQAEPLGISSPATLDPPRPDHQVFQDGATGSWRRETIPRPAVTLRHPDGLEVTEEALDVRTVRPARPARGDRPGSAAVDSWAAHRTVRLNRPESGWDVTVETHSLLTRRPAGFTACDEVVCRDGEEIVFHRTWVRTLF